MRRCFISIAASAVIVPLATIAHAQPVLILTPAADDISASGARTVGRLVEFYPGPTVAYVPYTWDRGVGFTRIPGTYGAPTVTRASADLSAIAADLENTSDWGDLNCFGGYCFGSSPGCTPGDPLPVPNPCPTHTIAHRYTAATGWVNAGSLPRLLDVGTGRYHGGTSCDQPINYPNDISGDGRYIVGGAWSTPLTAADGGPSYGLCGDFLAFRYDSQSGAVSELASASGSRTTRADRVNHDGSVITGYDLGSIPDGQGGFYHGRRLCVWTNGVQSILDPITDNAYTWPVNSPGTVIAGNPGSQFCQSTFGSGGIKLVRWMRQPNDSWAPQNLGRPVDRFNGPFIDILVGVIPTAVSADGNTIVGTAQYNAFGPSGLARAFVWRPSINGGVPIDLADYLQSISPSTPIVQPGLLLQFVQGISDDGNALLVNIRDGRDTCTNVNLSHVTFPSGVLYINGSSISCDPPRIALHPYDWAMEQDFVYIGAAMNVAVSGSWPLQYQWQREDPGSPGSWIDLEDGCSGFSPLFSYEGTHTAQLRVGTDPIGICGRLGRYRVVISNNCGSAVSNPATLSVRPAAYTQQPQSTSICATGQAFFSIGNEIPEDYPVYRRWQVESPEGSGTFVDIGGPGFAEPASGLAFDVLNEQMSTITVSNVRLGLHARTIVLRHAIDAYACGGTGTSQTATLTVCPADYDCNGAIEPADIALLVSTWLTSLQNGTLAGDADGNGFIEPADIAQFVNAWFAALTSGC